MSLNNNGFFLPVDHFEDPAGLCWGISWWIFVPRTIGETGSTNESFFSLVESFDGRPGAHPGDLLADSPAESC